MPTTGFYEPNYASGKAERWLIRRVDGDPFALAGIWEARRGDDGALQHSFSMLTINADGHAIMGRFHAPDDEKRSVVVVDPAHYRDWLQVQDEADARALLTLFDVSDFTTEAAPRPPRKASRG